MVLESHKASRRIATSSSARRPPRQLLLRPAPASFHAHAAAWPGPAHATTRGPARTPLSSPIRSGAGSSPRRPASAAIGSGPVTIRLSSARPVPRPGCSRPPSPPSLAVRPAGPRMQRCRLDRNRSGGVVHVPLRYTSPPPLHVPPSATRPLRYTSLRYTSPPPLHVPLRYTSPPLHIPPFRYRVHDTRAAARRMRIWRQSLLRKSLFCIVVVVVAAAVVVAVGDSQVAGRVRPAKAAAE